MFGQKPRQGTPSVPVLIIEDMVCFPHNVNPLFISNKPGLKAVDMAMAADRQILLVYKVKGQELLGRQSLADIASLCRINQVMRLPNNASRVLVECTERVRLLEVHEIFTEPQASYDALALDNSLTDPVRVRMRSLVDSFRTYMGLQKKIQPEVLASVEACDSPQKLVDLIAGVSSIPLERKKALFLLLEPSERLEEVQIALESEAQLLELREDVRSKVKKRLEQNQKEYFINEQIKELKGELGKEDEDPSGLSEIEERLKKLDLPDDVRARTATELKRLSRLPPMTPEAGIARTWLELIADLPWNSPAPPALDPDHTLEILNEDHYDLEEAKDRIVDYLASRHFNPGIKNPILCLVGPPGTGKTSLGRSIARSMGRTFVRASLGGVRDEAEIRGHRRTYVGALPGRIIQGIKKAGSDSPVFLLDEIDKLASDHRGDPSSALLEVLDPEQNHAFSDHYLELPYNLSRVLFIATANNLGSIPPALRDRMEIIEVPGYSPLEKEKIATGFIIPRQVKDHGLEPAMVTFTTEAIATMVERYTSEAGVRQLDRNIAKVIAKCIRGHLSATGLDQAMAPVTVDADMVHRFLKKPRHQPFILRESLPSGLAYGLAWTEHGGTVLPVEVALFPGKGDLMLTGNLGDVMKESARIALTHLKSSELLPAGPRSRQATRDIHVHVPEGAIPKDGPSAGITLAVALYSALNQIPVKPLLAMTGELTLTGRVLPVGGIREKVLAAHRLGFREVILPERNATDSALLPDEVKADMVIHHVQSFAEVLELTFPRPVAIA